MRKVVAPKEPPNRQILSVLRAFVKRNVSRNFLSAQQSTDTLESFCCTGWYISDSHIPVCIFTNPTLIELRQEIGQYDWLASPRADGVFLCSRTEIITKQTIECGL
ncbi:hypothetical protein AVEN_158780-1 [Araneus ventricosus]|uniref:Uncharacterized protein n=1 Tax=Araneus ventricosus TaxID=182803 RepID=A0A4Y2U5R0_ARAVE|nr:hypothetical protein AVEN_42446-1 [Araneus ventricosus]GBO07348.1 hypothetical protein AVEN_158780-1 [Araneus ventricosus]